MTDATAGRWRVDSDLGAEVRVWTHATAEPELYAASKIEGLRLADYLNRIEDALAAAEAKAALADEVRQKWLVLGPMLDGWSVRNLGEEDILPWLARYTALTEATQPKEEES